MPDLQQLEQCCDPSAAADALLLKQAVTGSHSMLQYPAKLLKRAKRRAQKLQASSLPTQQDEVWRQIILACSDTGCLTRQQLVAAFPAASQHNDGLISRLVRTGRVTRPEHGQLLLVWQALEDFLQL